MTATDELRHMLDDRGVEWSEYGDGYTEWYFRGSHFTAQPNILGRLIVCDLTPAQAIAATLGRGECRNISKVVDKYGQARFACSECGAWLDSRMLWNPEYPNGESPWVKDCKLNYCPNCGRKVVDE